MGFGDFYKEKKKQKKGKESKNNSSFSSAPTFVLPELVEKKRKEK